MFTGLIEQLGEVVSLTPKGEALFWLTVRTSFTEFTPGESIAVDGVCLTVLSTSALPVLEFDLSPETQALTTLLSLKPGEKVHLERALMMSSRLGGHLLSGHVDTTVYLKAKCWVGESLEMRFGELSTEHQAYVFTKGSIALGGVSLTLNQVEKGEFTVMLIPHTLACTKLKELEIGQRVNVEFDYLARAIAHQLALFSVSGKERLSC